MSTYLAMWEEVKALDLPATVELIDHLSPARGTTIIIGQVPCVDVDLLEALRYWRDDHPERRGRG